MIEFSIFQLFIFFLIIVSIINRPRVGRNEPPLVPYTIPLIGHTFIYLFNTKKFLKKCREQYGEIYSIYVFGQVWTILAGRTLNEMLKYADNFDFIAAIKEQIPMHQLLTYNGGFTQKGNEFNAKVTREQITPKLDLFIGIVQKCLLKGMDKLLGDCKKPKTIYNTWINLTDLIALPVAAIVVGEEAAKNEDLVKSFSRIAFDVGHLMIIPPIFAFIHQKLNDFMVTVPIKFGWNPMSYHRRVVVNRLRPIVERRLREKEKLGENYKPYNDLLEHFMSLPDFDYTKPNNFLYHVDNLFVLAFAAIHTTSRTVTGALFDMGARPEVLEELYEEALRIDRECNGQVTVADVKKMVKLDSLVKESLRTNDNQLVLPHYLKSESFTFSNGYTIQKGHKVHLYIDDVLKSKEAYGDDAEEFKPFRFVNQNSPATKVDRNYVVFGGGRHACPGRFFAINETKLCLHKLILNYKISSARGRKVEEKLRIGPFAMPSLTGGIVFENRVKNN